MFAIESTDKLIMGLLTGLVFGFLLQRGGVTQYRVIVGQFLWVDHTVIKTMFTAVVVGSIGVYGLHQFAATPLHLKGVVVAANLLGGIIFGIGMALLGYCPGTAVGAMGDGSRHAIFGLLGMFVGAAAYAEVYPLIHANLLQVGNFGKMTFPEITGLSPWLFVSALVVLALFLLPMLKNEPE
jgi:uncharacterized protein